MSDIILVGGGGYLGTRLAKKLEEEGLQVDNIDLGIYGNMEGGGRDVEALPPDYCEGTAVVWLAGFHRELDGHTDNPIWDENYYRLMVELPLQWCAHASRFFYVSSMRSLTEHDRLYGRTKRDAELGLLLKQATKMTCMRFGTVWGRGEYSADLPFRANTAVNSALTRKKFYGKTWSAHVTHVELAVASLLFYINYALSVEEFSDTGEIMNIVDPVSPLDWQDINALLEGKFDSEDTQELFNKEKKLCKGMCLEEDLEAIKQHRLLYGLEIE